MLVRILMLTIVGLASSPSASADPLDCNDMAPVVSEILVYHLQIPRYLALSTAAAASATFRMNYFHAERHEYHRTFCSAMIRFNPIGFAEAERRAAIVDPAQSREGLARAATGGLARYADFPDGLKVRYRLELMGNGTTWVVVVQSDPATDHICSLPDRHRYLRDGGACSPPLGQDLQWRRSGTVEADLPAPGR